MKKLLEGLVQFRKEDFESHRELFEGLGKNQNPHTLFIGCSDSRVVPNLITKTLPGELFVIRNIANIVPKYRETSEYVATTSAVEFALLKLKVEHIVVCGHSNCGGCAALYLPEKELELIPHTRRWLEQAQEVKAKVLSSENGHDHASREWLTEQTNVVQQMKNLLTYPYIREAFAAGKLQISGWHYIIETGEIFSYNRESGYFEAVN